MGVDGASATVGGDVDGPGTLGEPDASIEETLLEGAAKARAWATPFLARIRDAVGIRGLA